MTAIRKIYQVEQAAAELPERIAEAQSELDAASTRWALSRTDEDLAAAVAAATHHAGLLSLRESLLRARTRIERDERDAQKARASAAALAEERERRAAYEADPLAFGTTWRKTIQAHPEYRRYRQDANRIHSQPWLFQDHDLTRVPPEFVKRFAFHIVNGRFRDEAAKAAVVDAINAELVQWLRDWPAAKEHAIRAGHSRPAEGNIVNPVHRTVW